MAKKIAEQNGASTEFAACIGLDWATRSTAFAYKYQGLTRWRGEDKAHTSRARRLLLELRERFEGRPLAVCLELTRDPIVGAAAIRIHNGVPVNPQILEWFEDKGTLVFCRFRTLANTRSGAQGTLGCR